MESNNLTEKLNTFTSKMRNRKEKNYLRMFKRNIQRE